MKNSDWLLVHTAPTFQASRQVNYEWLWVQAAFLSFDVAVTSLEAYGARLGASYFPCRWAGCRDLLKVPEKSGRRDLLRERERGQRPN